MYQPKQVLVKKEYNGQVWYESYPISEAPSFHFQTNRKLNEPSQPLNWNNHDAEREVRSRLEQPSNSLSVSQDDLESNPSRMEVHNP